MERHVTGGTPPYMYWWNFGDGSPSATDPNPTHVYEQAGDFTTILTVTDKQDLMDTDEFDVTVE